MTEYVLVVGKPTDNKLRYVKRVDGVVFKLYIPKASLPETEPKRITVCIDPDLEQAEARPADIKAVVEYPREHSETIHYVPRGAKETWKIGEPYIPKTALPQPFTASTQPWPRQLHIAVSWEGHAEPRPFSRFLDE